MIPAKIREFIAPPHAPHADDERELNEGSADQSEESDSISPDWSPATLYGCGRGRLFWICRVDPAAADLRIDPMTTPSAYFKPSFFPAASSAIVKAGPTSAVICATEMCGITAISASEWLQKPGSVGRAVLGTVKITDDSGNELPPEQVGNVCFADGPRYEYHNDPAKTAEAYDRHGWATLGDIGRLDSDGYLFLTDRKHFMIISGGVNIYPQEIENLIITHPKVADVAVIGAPDEEMGEKVVAVIQPVNWTDAGTLLAEANVP